MVLTREVLDTRPCDDPECGEDHGPFYFHSKCHPEAPTWIYYHAGIITIECAECEEFIAEIAVARVWEGSGQA